MENPMSNHRFCCCGDDQCSSEYRRFVPCDEGLDTTPIVIFKPKFNECNFVEDLYLLTDNPACSDLYCGRWTCDPAITVDSNFCTSTGPDFCDCTTDDTYYLLRPSDNPCDIFERIAEEDDLEDGTCCDTRCPDRLSGCDSGPAVKCFGSELVRGCDCTSASDLTWDIDITWSPTSDNGSQRSNRDYVTSTGFVFEEYDSNVAVNLTTTQVEPYGTELCADGTIREYTFRVVLGWQGSVTQEKFPGYFDDGGLYGYRCRNADGTETIVQSYSIDELWFTTFMLKVGVSTVSDNPAYMSWTFAAAADKVDSGDPSFTCFGGSTSGTPYGMANIAGPFTRFTMGNTARTSNVVSGPSNIYPEDNAYTNGPRVCAGNSDSMYLSRMVPLGFPALVLDSGGYSFNDNYDAGELRIQLALAVPSTESCV